MSRVASAATLEAAAEDRADGAPAARTARSAGQASATGGDAELLFQVLTEREERSAIAIASNEPFSGWTKTFTDPRLRAAIVDRLTFAGQIIETGTTSYRLAHARKTRAAS
jgi:DNA replication protein DnaC